MSPLPSDYHDLAAVARAAAASSPRPHSQPQLHPQHQPHPQHKPYSSILNQDVAAIAVAAAASASASASASAAAAQPRSRSRSHEADPSLSHQPRHKVEPHPDNSHSSFGGVDIPRHGLQSHRPAPVVTPPRPGTHRPSTEAEAGQHNAHSNNGQPSRHYESHVYASIENGLSDMPPTPMQALATSPTTPSSAHNKVTRLRRACDMCSQRKVKCDESGPPCKPCADLDVECTFTRTMKRRGPPNKHAEAAKAAKRAREDGSGTIEPSPVAQPQPQPQPQVLSPILLQDGTNEILDGELVAPWPVMELLVDDFFTYIHPLVPFPHEPTFRQAFANRMDRVSREFLALLASMIGILVASFPRSARAHLKSTHSTNLFPTSLTMIERCRHVALVARGSVFMAKHEMTADDAATSYFLGLASAYALQERLCNRFMAETMIFCREVMSSRQKLAVSIKDELAKKPPNHIQDQMNKRIFWVIVASVRSMTQLGWSINELPLPPPTAQEPYPDQPLEVDDEFIYADHILPQPEGILPLIAGFNRNIRVYTTMNELVGVDMCYGIGFFDWSAQKNILFNGLAAAKGSTEGLPIELQVKIEQGQIQDSLGFEKSDLRYYPPSFPLAQPANDVRHAFSQHPMRRRQLQFEIQKANIHGSQLATRSYFVERYLNLQDAHRSQYSYTEGGEHQDKEDDRDLQVAQERELIVQNLLTVLASINQRNIEPNGGSLVNKIRQVAGTLLNDAPERKGTMAVKADEYLGRFLEILTKLEKTGAPSSMGTMTPQDEEQELQHWASLRDIQIQFAECGEF